MRSPAQVEGRRVKSEPRTPGWSEKHLRLAIQAAGVALWSWNVDNDDLTMDERAYQLWGLPPSSTSVSKTSPPTFILPTATG